MNNMTCGKWLSATEMYGELRQVAMTNSTGNTNDVQNDTLSAILFDVWSAKQRLIGFPSVCLLIAEPPHAIDVPRSVVNLGSSSRVLGILSGYPWHSEKCFFIEHLGLLSGDETMGVEGRSDLYHSLVEEAIDYSLELGFHGWVASNSDHRDADFWRKLSFYQHDDTTFRRMGYFADFTRMKTGCTTVEDNTW